MTSLDDIELISRMSKALDDLSADKIRIAGVRANAYAKTGIDMQIPRGQFVDYDTQAYGEQLQRRIAKERAA